MERWMNLISGLMASATVVHGDDDGNGLCFIINMRWCIAKAIWSPWKRLQAFIIILDGMSTNRQRNLITQTDRQTDNDKHTKTNRLIQANI